jgi:ABC-type enterochelin transport system ATPase subunit
MHDGRVSLSGPVSEVIHSPELKDAFDNRISVYTLDSGRPVIVAAKDGAIERGIQQKEV